MRLAEFGERWARATPTSRALAEAQRQVIADARTSFGYEPRLRQVLYPLTYEHARGSKLWDVDGNEYVDVAMSFGAALFGHAPPFVADAVRAELERGVPLLAHSPRLLRVGELFAGLTGSERMLFCTTGTEAMMNAVRLARAATSRDRIVRFDGSFHGTFEAVLDARGVPTGVRDDALVLTYGDEAALEVIDREGPSLAAVVCETVQGSRPWLVPVDFLRALREICTRHGVVLLFDEIVTGFRCHPGGFQGLTGIRADLAAYGKASAGGYPIGIVAGRADLLEEVDGGAWRYDCGPEPRSVPPIYGGTFTKHPLSLAAAEQVLGRLAAEGPGLQRALDAKTERLATRLREVAEPHGVEVHRFSSVVRFTAASRQPMDPLFRFLMLANGVHMLVLDRVLLSTEHDEADCDRVVEAVRASLAELYA